MGHFIFNYNFFNEFFFDIQATNALGFMVGGAEESAFCNTVNLVRSIGTAAAATVGTVYFS